MNARRALVWLAMVMASVGTFMACGLDESGLLPVDASIDVVGTDVPPKDAPLDVPLGCTTLDATACLDSGLPDGWSYVGIATTPAACPGADYSQQQYVDNLQLEAGACTCGNCTSFGAYSCARSLTYSNGNGPKCGNVGFTIDAGDDAGCIPTTGTSADNHIQIDLSSTPPTSKGAGCDASVAGGQGFTSDGVTACTPKCAADYCHIPSPFQRCILSATQRTCPPPFMPATTGPIGPTSAVQVRCEACSCRFGPTGGCAPSIEAWGNGTCNGNDQGAVAPGTCTSTLSNVGSFFYDPGTPAVNCLNTDGGSGTVDFASSLTVCCLP